MRKHIFLIYAVLWVLMIASTFYQQMVDIRGYAQEIAAKQAETFFENIVALRQWHTQCDGVYTAVAGQTQSNPDIKAPGPDTEAKDDSQPAVIDPVCISKGSAENAHGKTGIRFHITSLNPLRPENKADAWESAALQAFAKGEAGRGEIFNTGSETFYRYMTPLPVDAGCLKCHTQKGIRIGNKYGGISASIPLGNIDELVSKRLQELGLTHVIIALAGLIAMLAAYLAHQKMARRLDKAKRHLQLAYLDVLTQLPNRRYYDFFVNREWKRAMRQGYPLSMIMIDIDYFKIYNDNMGHIQGDHCLQQVAKTLRRYFRRAGDLIARYGGEEFCVVAACDAEQIKQLAEILRKAVEDMQLPHPGSKISSFVTVSLGTATMVPIESMEFEELLRRADQTLYRAKENGRNRVETYNA